MRRLARVVSAPTLLITVLLCTSQLMLPNIAAAQPSGPSPVSEPKRGFGRGVIYLNDLMREPCGFAATTTHAPARPAPLEN